MDSILHPGSLSTTVAAITTTSSCALQFPCLLTSRPGRKLLSLLATSSDRGSALRRSSAVSASGILMANAALERGFACALEILVKRRITGFPVIDDDWKLVGLVSDFDLLALDSISGGGLAKNSMFPEVDSTWKTFNEVQKLLSKANGKVVGDLMTPASVVVHETTNLEDAARFSLSIFSFHFENSRTEKSFFFFQLVLNSCGLKIECPNCLSDVRLLLETKYRRIAVVDVDGKLLR